METVRHLFALYESHQVISYSFQYLAGFIDNFLRAPIYWCNTLPNKNKDKALVHDALSEARCHLAETSFQ